MPTPAADRTRRFAWLAGAACLVCCLVPVVGVVGVTGVLSTGHVLAAVAVAVLGAVTWWLTRRRHRCATGCGCQS